MNFRPEPFESGNATNLVAKVVDQTTGSPIAYCETFEQAEFIAEALIAYSTSK
jgi:hypothetical protein